MTKFFGEFDTPGRGGLAAVYGESSVLSVTHTDQGSDMKSMSHLVKLNRNICMLHPAPLLCYMLCLF